MEADRTTQAANTAPSDPRRDRHRRFAHAYHTVHTRGRSVAVRAQTPQQRQAEAKTLAASSPQGKPTDTTPPRDVKAADAKPGDAKEIGPINAIFVLASRPFDPYGGDYAPWLDRLSWARHFDRADDRTIFTTEGYGEADRAPDAEPVSTRAADELARRTDALSQRGFQALKLDLGRS